MTDTIRDLLISLSSHMAYMQGQLEAHHEFDDPEDYYWYRESVLLRQKVTDALLADEPAVPDEKEPAAVISEPSDREVLELAQQYSVVYLLSDGSACYPFQDGHDMRNDLLSFARAVLARWGNLKESLTSSSSADGEVGELTGQLIEAANGAAAMDWNQHAQRILREPLQRQVPLLEVNNG